MEEKEKIEEKETNKFIEIVSQREEDIYTHVESDDHTMRSPVAQSVFSIVDVPSKTTEKVKKEQPEV